MPQSKSRVESLGTEKVGKLLFEMASQTTFSLIVYAVYSITDTYFLSVGINALAAAGASIISPVLIALGGVSTIVGVGGASVVSRALGEKNNEKASRTIANTFLIFWTVAISISIFGTIFIKPIVHILGASETIAPYAIEYGRIIFLGAITSTGYSAIIRADGNARFSTAIWVIPVTTNLFFCWLFIMVLHFGAASAALATVIGQSVSAGMSVYFFFFRKNRSYYIKAKYFKPDRGIIREVLIIGLPSFLKSISASLVVIITNNLLNVIGGDSALSIYAIISKLFSALNMPQTGIMQGMQPIIGFNFGQARFDRVKKAISISLFSSIIYGCMICLLSFLFPSSLIGLLSKDTSIINEGQSALKLLSLAFPVGGIGILIAAFFQSVGKARDALILTLGGIFLVKLPVLIMGSKMVGLSGIWISEAISELILCAAAFFMLKKYQGKVLDMAIQTDNQTIANFPQ